METSCIVTLPVIQQSYQWLEGLTEADIHAGAKVYYENEDLSCPTQLACKTALLKVLESFLGLRPRLIMSSSTQNTTLAYKILS